MEMGNRLLIIVNQDQDRRHIIGMIIDHIKTAQDRTIIQDRMITEAQDQVIMPMVIQVAIQDHDRDHDRDLVQDHGHDHVQIETIAENQCINQQIDVAMVKDLLEDQQN